MNCCGRRPSTRRSQLELFDDFTIKGLANITGGGVLENLPRVMPEEAHAPRSIAAYGTIPPVFDLIRGSAESSQAEMDKTFNNGIGMIAVAAADKADAVLQSSQETEAAARSAIGTFIKGARGVTFV